METTEELPITPIEEIVRNITEDHWISPRMSREDILAEARQLLISMKRDKEALLNRRLPLEVYNNFEERINFYELASGRHVVTLFDRSEVRNEWASSEKEMYRFKWDIIDELEFGLRRNTKALKYISEVAKGRGRRDLVCDLGVIAELLEKYRTEMEEINFDFTQLELCKTYHKKLSTLLAKIETSPELIEEHRILAAQAYTYLHEAVLIIREYGQHVFRRDPKKLDDYKSDFYQEKGKLNNQTTVEI